jgi:hypothetical protein
MLLAMLVVGTLIYRAKDPAVWKWLAPGEEKPKAAAPDVPTRAESTASPGRKPGDDLHSSQSRGDQTPIPGLTPGAQTLIPPGVPAKPPGAKVPAKPQAEEAAAKPQVGEAAAKPQAAEGGAKLEEPEPAGLTDEDPDERDEMVNNDALVIEDGTLHTSRTDQFAYSRLLIWVKNQSLARLRERVPKENEDVRYDRFVADPNEMRLQIVEIPLDVRQVEDYGVEGPGGGELYEVQGFNREKMLFFGVVEGLPEGWPSGPQVQEQVRLVGYFFKLQGYYPASGKARGAPLRAPVIIGRLDWQPSLVAPRDTTPGWVWGALAMGVIVIVGGGMMLKSLLVGRLFRRPPRVRLPSLSPDPDAPTVDDWLNMAQSGGMGAGRNIGDNPGNNFSGNGESRSGHGEPGPADQDSWSPLPPGEG